MSLLRRQPAAMKEKWLKVKRNLLRTALTYYKGLQKVVELIVADMVINNFWTLEIRGNRVNYVGV